MKPDTGDPTIRVTSLLAGAKEALRQGDRAEARRLARRAVALAPEDEKGWLLLAAASEPRAGLAYAARALEINPASQTAQKAIRWLLGQLPRGARGRAVQEIHLPEDLSLHLAPLDSLARRRLLSAQVVLPAFALLIGLVVWFGSQPADAGQPKLAAGPVAKASFTPTATSTPTPTATHTDTPTPTPTDTPAPSPTPTSRPNFSWEYSLDPAELAHEGRWIDVDLSSQRVIAYDGTTPVRTFVVSTGTWRHPTVTGQFRIYVKLPSTTMAGPGYYLPGVPWTMYFYRGYGLHGTYWHSNFGTPMSHGCVNLTIEEAEWLFNFASVGTLVNVHP